MADDLGLNLPKLGDVLTAGALGALGRMMRFVHEDNRRWGYRLWLFELPVGFVSGLLGEGLARYFALKGFPEIALIVSAGYIGPRALDGIFDAIIVRIKGEKK